jgi:C4-dicarboxylate transporter
MLVRYFWYSGLSVRVFKLSLFFAAMSIMFWLLLELLFLTGIINTSGNTPEYVLYSASKNLALSQEIEETIFSMTIPFSESKSYFFCTISRVVS